MQTLDHDDETAIHTYVSYIQTAGLEVRSGALASATLKRVLGSNAVWFEEITDVQEEHVQAKQETKLNTI